MRTQQVCPICATEVIAITGPEDAEILIVGSSPSDDDIAYGKPFQGNIGGIFRKELRKYAGFELSDCRQAMTWYHAPTKGKSASQCLEVSKEIILAEMVKETTKVIILVGPDAVREFAGYTIDSVNGLNIEQVGLEYMRDFPNEPQIIFALVNPSLAVTDRGIGELRFGLKNLNLLLQEFWREHGNDK